MPGEDEPLHAYVEVNTPGKYSSWRMVSCTLWYRRVTSPSKCRKQLQRSRRSFNKGLMWVFTKAWLIDMSCVCWHASCDIFALFVLQYLSSKCIFLAAARRLQPAAPDAAKGAGDAQWHSQRGRHSKHIHSFCTEIFSCNHFKSWCLVYLLMQLTRSCRHARIAVQRTIGRGSARTSQTSPTT